MALYEVETERLLLRQWRDGDWHGLHRTYGDAEVMGWIGAATADLASTAAAVGRLSMHWRLLGYGMFAVEERSMKDGDEFKALVERCVQDVAERSRIV
jgi:RimJ/RimL family protein N-acetyltransferase